MAFIDFLGHTKRWWAGGRFMAWISCGYLKGGSFRFHINAENFIIRIKFKEQFFSMFQKKFITSLHFSRATKWIKIFIKNFYFWFLMLIFLKNREGKIQLSICTCDNNLREQILLFMIVKEFYCIKKFYFMEKVMHNRHVCIFRVVCRYLQY